MYRTEKFDIREENLYDNSKGRGLLFEARARFLRTKSFVGKYSQNDGACVVCGKEREVISHILLKRDCIHPNTYEGNIRLLEDLEFKGDTEKIKLQGRIGD